MWRLYWTKLEGLFIAVLLTRSRHILSKNLSGYCWRWFGTNNLGFQYILSGSSHKINIYVHIFLQFSILFSRKFVVKLSMKCYVWVTHCLGMLVLLRVLTKFLHCKLISIHYVILHSFGIVKFVSLISISSEPLETPVIILQ